MHRRFHLGRISSLCSDHTLNRLPREDGRFPHCRYSRARHRLGKGLKQQQQPEVLQGHSEVLKVLMGIRTQIYSLASTLKSELQQIRVLLLSLAVLTSH